VDKNIQLEVCYSESLNSPSKVDYPTKSNINLNIISMKPDLVTVAPNAKDKEVIMAATPT
jgi:hypothetical protein